MAVINLHNAEISRVTRSKEEAQANYDRISSWYDVLEGYSETRSRELALQRLFVREGESVLEIGVGTGHSVLALAQAVGESGRVFGIDLSPKMLEITRARLSRAGLLSRVKLERGDAGQLPYEAGVIDAVFMSFVLELFDTPEIPRVLSGCRRVLKEGGRICVVSLSKQGKSNWMRSLYEWGHDHYPGLLDCRPIFVQKALEEAGFQTREAARLSLWGLPVELVVAYR
jgi:ubiquinone/menaquinone biosynthesis C-methylase UbiE